MFRTFAAVLFGLSLLMTEQVLAFCPNPLTPDSMCCTYAGPNGTTDNRSARSLNGCLADVRATNNLLINSQAPTCFSLPRVLPTVSYPASIIRVDEFIDPAVAPLDPSGEWRQNFTHSYIASTTSLQPPVVYTCAT